MSTELEAAIDWARRQAAGISRGDLAGKRYTTLANAAEKYQATLPKLRWAVHVLPAGGAVTRHWCSTEYVDEIAAWDAAVCALRGGATRAIVFMDGKIRWTCTAEESDTVDHHRV